MESELSRVPKAWFKYKTLDALREEVAALGVDVPLTEDLEPLHRPLQAGPLQIGNRLGIHPMEGCDGNTDGTPGELTYRRYQRFGAGGAGLIWFEACAVSPESRANPRQLVLNQQTAPSIARLLQVGRDGHRDAFGSDSRLYCGLQLTHSGRYSHGHAFTAVRDPLLDRRKGLAPDHPVLTDAELAALPALYAEAAVLARECGFDFVDIKQCHRYLLNELLAARERPGPYGGSFENRTRLLREITAAVRAAAPDLPLASRLNVYDGVPYEPDPETHVGRPSPHETPYPWGFGCDPTDPECENLDEPIQLLRLLRDLGYCLVNVTAGNPYANPHVGRPFERPPLDGYETPEHPLLGVARHFRMTAALKAAVPEIALVGTGYSWLRHFLGNAAAANIGLGRVDIAAAGRGAIAYPDFARDLLTEGIMHRQKACVAVSYCTALMRFKHNPEGQFAAGCVPRDDAYAVIYQEALAALGQGPGARRKSLPVA